MPAQPPLITVPPPTTPSVPGAINIPAAQLKAADIFPISALGQNSAQTTLGDIQAFVLAGVVPGQGTVTNVSASVPAGMAVAVANPSSTPAISITLVVSGLLKAAAGAFLAAVAAVDYVAPGDAVNNGITVPTQTLLGRGAAGTGPLQEITLGANLALSALGVLSASGGGGSGTVTTVSVVSANGFAGSVANPTTAPAITITTAVTGLLKGNGTAVSAAAAGTDYVVPGGALGTPSSGTLTNCTGYPATALAAIANNTVLGNVSGISASPIALTATQITTLINAFTTGLSGAVPASGGGTTNFLRADGTFAAPPGTGVTAVSIASANGFAGSSSGGATPALTLTTTITGVLKGNGTAISAAAAGTDYVAPGGALGTPSSGTLTNCTGYPASALSGTVSLTTQVTGILPGANGGTGVANTGKTVTLGASITTTGAGAPTLAFPAGAATYTYPGASQTLASLAGAETLTNKSMSGGSNTFTLIPVSALNSGTNAGATTFWRGDGTWTGVNIQMSSYQGAAPSGSALTLSYIATEAFTFPANLSTSKGVASVAATASTVFNVQQNGSTIGTITFGAAGTTATFATSGGTSKAIAIGDLVTIVAPASPDATLAGITITLLGTRT